MKKVMALAVAALLSTFLLTTVHAGPVDTSAAKKKETRTTKPGATSGQIAPKSDGTSVLERYNKRVEVKKRAAERRKAEMQKSPGQGTGPQ